MAQSCLARLAKLYAMNDGHAFKTLLFKQIGIALAFGIAGILFSLLWGGPFLGMGVCPEYGEYTSVFLIVMVSAALNHLADFTGNALTATRSIKIQPLFWGVAW